MNPAAAVRGPKHVVKTGKTPVLESAEWRRLLEPIPTLTLRDLQDRALSTTFPYSFARITAALNMKVEDLRPRGAGWTVLPHDAVPPRARRGVARLYRCRRHCRGPQRVAVRHRAPAQCRRANRPPDESIRRLAHDPPVRGCGRHQRADRQSYLSCHGITPLTSPTAARSSTPRKWRPMRAREQPSFTTTGRRSG
jgi:hypothetical protein